MCACFCVAGKSTIFGSHESWETAVKIHSFRRFCPCPQLTVVHRGTISVLTFSKPAIKNQQEVGALGVGRRRASPKLSWLGRRLHPYPQGCSCGLSPRRPQRRQGKRNRWLQRLGMEAPPMVQGSSRSIRLFQHSSSRMVCQHCSQSNRLPIRWPFAALWMKFFGAVPFPWIINQRLTQTVHPSGGHDSPAGGTQQPPAQSSPPPSAAGGQLPGQHCPSSSTPNHLCSRHRSRGNSEFMLS